VRSLNTASEISRLAFDLGLRKQALVLNRAEEDYSPPSGISLPAVTAKIPALASLMEKQQYSASVLDLPEHDFLDQVCEKVLQQFR
jgi:CO dehydrogenase maturation factor